MQIDCIDESFDFTAILQRATTTRAEFEAPKKDGSLSIGFEPAIDQVCDCVTGLVKRHR
jgi:hypothetical protein